jgi:bifunctional non-homologous end joining protein LigD
LHLYEPDDRPHENEDAAQLRSSTRPVALQAPRRSVRRRPGVRFGRVALRLPDPMLTRPAELPLGPGYAYEVKWDGFRAVVSTLAGLRVRSRRGWDMSDRLPELKGLPEGVALDGELVALGDDGRPSFPRLSNRILHGRDGIAVTYVIFDMLAYDAESTMVLPYSERRSILERLKLAGHAWCTPDVFDDGERLFAAVVERGLEGIVAKPLASTYRPGERDWLKVKNRSYWRFGQELELTSRPRRAFV